MSLTQSAFVERARVPDRAKLEASIRALGFQLTLDESYEPFESSGFLPCLLNGVQSGFEIDFGSTDDALEDFPHLKERLGARDCEMTFRFGTATGECACVLIVCAALATDCDAVVHYDADDLFYSAPELINEANSALKGV